MNAPCGDVSIATPERHGVSIGRRLVRTSSIRAREALLTWGDKSLNTKHTLASWGMMRGCIVVVQPRDLLLSGEQGGWPNFTMTTTTTTTSNPDDE